MNFQLGLKAWTTNLPLIPEAVALHREGKLDYIELFCVPHTARDTSGHWANTGIPYVIHAAHSLTGLNYARHEMREANRELTFESFFLADALRSTSIVFHPGSDGKLSETLSQIKSLRDDRMILENKPLRGLNGVNCVGSTVSEMSELCSALDLRFCLDFGHATAAANSYRVPPLDFIHSFLSLNPSLFHLTDGDFASELDHHDQYGKGSFPLEAYLKMVPPEGLVTDEAKRACSDKIDEYLTDRIYIAALRAGQEPPC